jgi:methionyl-tRNA formyltransferase
MNKLRIAFMGTPDFSVPALQSLIEGPHDVVAVYSQPPRPKGRGKKVQPSPVQALAEQHNIPVYTPLSFKKDADAVATFEALNLDIAIVAAYGLILPLSVLNAPKFGCLNIHASLLPRWRGASPIQHAIWKGDDKSGICIMQMELGLDTGPVISEQSMDITPGMTATELHDALSQMGGAMVADILDHLASGDNITATPQDDSISTYAPMLKKEDGHVNWNDDATAIDRQIRALTPWPGVWTQSESGKRLKIIAAKLTSETSTDAAGTLCDKKGHVACGDNTVLQLTIIQPENAKAMDIASALNGNYIEIGQKL